MCWVNNIGMPINLIQQEKDGAEEPVSSKSKEKTGWFASLLLERKKSSGEDGAKKQDSPKQGNLAKAQVAARKPFFKRLFSSGSENNGLDISLMPEKVIIIPRIIYSRTLILIAALTVIITVFTITWLYFDWHFEKIKNEIEKIDREMKLVEVQTLPFLVFRDEVAELEANAARTEKILNDHIYWTKFFGLLEKYTTADVYFGDFSADTTGIVRLDSVGRDLISIARQIVVFSQAADFIKEVSVSDVAKTPLGIKATFSLVLANNVFKR